MFGFIRVFLIAAAMLAQYQSAAAADTTAQAQPAEAQGIGVVKTKDEQNRTVTLAHDPIEGFHWPAMTMKFKVANPAILQDIAPGTKVQFTLRGKDMNTTVLTAIKPVE